MRMTKKICSLLLAFALVLSLLPKNACYAARTAGAEKSKAGQPMAKAIDKISAACYSIFTSTYSR